MYSRYTVSYVTACVDYSQLWNLTVCKCANITFQIVRRHLTSQPDLEASRELLDISYRLCRIPEQDFRQAIDEWHEKWREFLSEKSVGLDGMSHYTHPKPRAAYRSLKFYMPYLWTYDHYPEFYIPNTNAAIESLNQRLKTLLRNHSGISSQRRMRLLEEYIARHYWQELEDWKVGDLRLLFLQLEQLWIVYRIFQPTFLQLVLWGSRNLGAADRKFFLFRLAKTYGYPN